MDEFKKFIEKALNEVKKTVQDKNVIESIDYSEKESGWCLVAAGKYQTGCKFSIKIEYMENKKAE